MSKKAYLAKVLLIVAVMLLAACSKTAQLPLLSPDATVLAFGDSLTAGTGAGEAESYPAVLSALTGLRVINAGVPGEVSGSGLLRLPELLDRERPSLLILCHGGNDLIGHTGHQLIADNLRTMIRLAMERGIPVLLIAVPSPDLSLTPPPLYADVAKEFTIPIEVKALPHILAKGTLKSDYIHPNAAGYRMLAEALVDLLKKSGALPR
ncbi:MAG: GDSL-type esterase/lipase family protein [Desulfuromonadaceae bacterium]